MEDTPHANTTNSGNDKHKVLWVGEELDSFSAFFCDSGGEVIEGALESHSDEIENAEEGTTDDDKREDADTEDATEVSREGFAVLKEENSAFQGSFCGVFVFAIEDPTKTTVTKIVDDGLDDTGDGAANGAASIATNASTNRTNGVTELAENALDGVSCGVVSGDGEEPVFNDFLAFTIDVFW